MQLTEKYRPKAFSALVGQEKAVRIIQHTTRNGTGKAIHFIVGPSGCGKTTLARIVASQHCGETGIVMEYGSGDDITASVMNDMEERFKHSSMLPQAIIVNEAHRMKAAVVAKMLGIMENMPAWAYMAFTTTMDGEGALFDGVSEKELVPFFRRATRVQLTRRLDTGSLTEVYAKEVQRIAIAEGLDGGRPLDDFKKLVTKADNSIGYALKLVDDGILL